MRKQVPLIITFIVGILMMVPTFVPHPPFDRFEQDFSDFFAILAGFALVLGAANLFAVHMGNVARQKKGWGYSIVVLVAFVFTFVAGMFKIANPKGMVGPLEEPGSWFQWIYEYLFSPLTSTMFALLAFFVASASYRAFRAKNREATILLLAAFVILMGRTVVGSAVSAIMPGAVEVFFGSLLLLTAFQAYRSKSYVATGITGVVGGAAVVYGLYAFAGMTFGSGAEFISIPEAADFIRLFPGKAGQRAIMIGICLGVISMSLRIILGVERSHLGTEE